MKYVKYNIEEITPYTRWITALDDNSEEIAAFEKKVVGIVEKYYKKAGKEIDAEVAALSNKTGFDWDVWMSDIDIMQLQDVGDFTEHVREYCIKQIMKNIQYDVVQEAINRLNK
jgi:hypothetical protein